MWYVSRGTSKQGPFSQQNMLRFVEAGRLFPTDMVWRSGMTEWKPAAEVGDLFPPTGNGETTMPLRPLDIPPLRSTAKPALAAAVDKPPTTFGGYLLAHWQGRLGLATSFWLNVILIGLLFMLVAPNVLGPILVTAPSVGALAFFGVLFFYPIMVIWQFVGLYRCALAHITAPKTSFKLWAHLSLMYSVLPVTGGLAFLVVGIIGGVSQLGSNANATFTTISSSM